MRDTAPLRQELRWGFESFYKAMVIHSLLAQSGGSEFIDVCYRIFMRISCKIAGTKSLKQRQKYFKKM